MREMRKYDRNNLNIKEEILSRQICSPSINVGYAYSVIDISNLH